MNAYSEISYPHCPPFPTTFWSPSLSMVLRCGALPLFVPHPMAPVTSDTSISLGGSQQVPQCIHDIWRYSGGSTGDGEWYMKKGLISGLNSAAHTLSPLWGCTAICCGVVVEQVVVVVEHVVVVVLVVLVVLLVAAVVLDLGAPVVVAETNPCYLRFVENSSSYS